MEFTIEDAETTPQNAREADQPVVAPSHSGGDVSTSLIDLGTSTVNDGPRDNSLFDHSLNLGVSLPTGDTRQAFNEGFMEPQFPEEDRMVRPSENTRTVEAQLAMLGGGGFNDEVEDEGEDFNNQIDKKRSGTTTQLEEADYKPVEGLGVGPLDDN